MWSRRVVLGAAVLPLGLLVTWDAPGRPVPREPVPVTAEQRPERGPRPAIVSRAVWRADESLVEERPKYVKSVEAAFVHHTSHPNDYDCADVPAMLRALQRDHVRREGWDDLGYNFVVDRCGNLYEGRAGGVERAVYGAHTKGFNAYSVGIAVVGSYGAGAAVPRAVTDGITKIVAWKLRGGADPQGTVRLVSTHDESRYPKGTPARLDVVSGHRDSYHTSCPGDALYGHLPAIREGAARLRGGG